MTWGCVQSLVGLVVFCGCRCRDREIKWLWYKGTIIVFWERGEGLSLGLFVFVKQRKEDRIDDEKHMLSNVTKEAIAHELGHYLSFLVAMNNYNLILNYINDEETANQVKINLEKQFS